MLINKHTKIQTFIIHWYWHEGRLKSEIVGMTEFRFGQKLILVGIGIPTSRNLPYIASWNSQYPKFALGCELELAKPTRNLSQHTSKLRVSLQAKPSLTPLMRIFNPCYSKIKKKHGSQTSASEDIRLPIIQAICKQLNSTPMVFIVSIICFSLPDDGFLVPFI